MRKTLKLLLLLIPLALLSACAIVHPHTFAEEWTSDAVAHWHESTCEHKGLKSEFANHTFGDWTNVEGEANKQQRVCSVCGYKEIKTLPVEEHTHTFGTTYTVDEHYHWLVATCHDDVTTKKELHTYGEFEIITAPTDTTTGSMKHTCVVCGYEETVEIPVLPHVHIFNTNYAYDDNYHWHQATCGHAEAEVKELHTYGEWQIEKEPTEEETGLKYKECTVCGNKYYEDIPVLPHTHKFSTEWSSNALTHWHDSTCGHDLVSGFAMHEFGEWNVVTEVTNENDGLRERTCSVCGYVEKEVIEAPHHVHTFSDDWNHDEFYHWHDATCNHDVVDAKGEHEFGEWGTITPATETEEGSEERVCSVCGYKETRVIPVIGHVHTFSDELAYNAIYHFYPATCGHTDVKDLEKHTLVLKEVIDPTCEEKGYTVYVCEKCGYETRLNYTDPIGHNYQATYTWNNDLTKVVIKLICFNCRDTKTFEFDVKPVTVEATCEEAGSVTGTIEFNFNNQTFTNSKSYSLEPIGHQYKFDHFVWSDDHTVKALLVCGNDNTHTKEVDATVVEKSKTPSTCITKGNAVYTATYENETEDKEFELELDPDNHVKSDEWAFDEDKHWHTASCGHDHKFDEAEHTFGEWVVTVPATEDDYGEKTRTCECGYHEDEIIEKLPHVHNWSEWTIVKEATETEIGLRTRTCSKCGEVEEEIIPVVIIGGLFDVIYDGTYYDTIDTALLDDTNALKAELNRIISANYVKFSYTQAFNKLDTVDSYDGGHYVECIYTGEKMNPENHGYWNREHVWAKSHGIKTADDSSTSDGKRNYAYSDLHHLRASENSINSTRNNRYFDEVSHDLSHDNYGNYWDGSNAFEPRDEVKGDIARMLFYMTIRYNGSEASQYLKLTLTDDLTKASQSVNYTYGTTTVVESFLGKLSTLVKWSYEDPVDDREISRNNAIFELQKNRNPFIDHPELVYYIFNTESANCGVTLQNLSAKVAPKHKNNTDVNNVETLINNIGTVTTESGDAISAARTAFNALDELSKSFITKYYLLKAAEETYKQLTTVQDTTIDTKFYFIKTDTEPGLQGNKSGSLSNNGIALDYTVTSSTAPSDTYGLYSQNNKPVTFVVSGLYDISKFVLKADSTNASITGTIKITDGVKTVSGSFTSSETKKDYKNFELNVSELDPSKTWTITINSGSSWRIPEITFAV